jgi:hypothetical protein
VTSAASPSAYLRRSLPTSISAAIGTVCRPLGPNYTAHFLSVPEGQLLVPSLVVVLFAFLGSRYLSKAGATPA